MPGAVAKRYAAALFELALDRGLVEEIDAQAQFLEELFAQPDVRHFFGSPRIPAIEKRQLIDRQLAGQLDPLLVRLMKLLIDKRRIDYLPQIMREFDKFTDRHRGVEEVTIVSAVPLSQEQRQQILNEVGRFTTYGELRVQTEIDSGVLGGVKVRLGENVVIDGTISNQLHEMREALYRYRHRGVGA